MPSKKIRFSRKYVKDVLKLYYKKYPQEAIRHQFERILNSNKSLISRKNFLGHITASAVVLNPTLSKILLVNHRSLGKSIQPGGHIDENDSSFLKAAMRELAEETGFINVIPLSSDAINFDIPFDIDVHKIPENKEKQEPEHWHFDFRYLLLLTGSQQGKTNRKEVDGIFWKPIMELEQLAPTLSRFSRKVKDFISQYQK